MADITLTDLRRLVESGGTCVLATGNVVVIDTATLLTALQHDGAKPPEVLGSRDHLASTTKTRLSGDTGNLPNHLTLTQRQLEVLTVMAEGVPQREVARRLNVSERTVQFHLAGVRKTLGISSQFQLGFAIGRLSSN